MGRVQARPHLLQARHVVLHTISHACQREGRRIACVCMYVCMVSRYRPSQAATKRTTTVAAAATTSSQVCSGTNGKRRGIPVTARVLLTLSGGQQRATGAHLQLCLGAQGHAHRLGRGGQPPLRRAPSACRGAHRYISAQMPGRVHPQYFVIRTGATQVNLSQKK
eukprot:COSAG01_NODE_5578_length_4171_cov_12.697200_2_plen_165_part_00